MNRKVRDVFPFLKSPNIKKYVSLSFIGVLLVAIPLLVYEVTNLQSPQTINQHAANPGPRQYPCGSLTIYLHTQETPYCNSATGSGTVSGLSSYQVTNTISNAPSGYKLTYTWAEWFCPTENSSAPCNSSSPNSVEKTISQATTTFDSSGDANAPSDTISPSNGFSACGYYQLDFAFAVKTSGGGIVCQYGNLSDPTPSGNNADYSFCHSNKTCTVTPPTPTPTVPVNTPTPSPTTPVIPSDTPTVIPSDTPVPSDTPIPSDSPTPGLTVTPTDTPTDTPTGTITPAPSDTPTPTTPPNQPTNTPAPTPKPTLPPTGPGNVFVSTGLIGAAIVVIGLVFAIGL